MGYLAKNEQAKYSKTPLICSTDNKVLPWGTVLHVFQTNPSCFLNFYAYITLTTTRRALFLQHAPQHPTKDSTTMKTPTIINIKAALEMIEYTFVSRCSSSICFRNWLTWPFTKSSVYFKTNPVDNREIPSTCKINTSLHTVKPV